MFAAYVADQVSFHCVDQLFNFMFATMSSNYISIIRLDVQWKSQLIKYNEGMQHTSKDGKTPAVVCFTATYKNASRWKDFIVQLEQTLLT